MRKRRRNEQLCPQNHVMYLGIPGQSTTIKVSVPCSDALEKVKITRSIRDVLVGNQGLSASCADAQCALRSWRAFGFKVYYAEFTKTCAYVVDAVKNGLPSHCIRYEHDDDTIPRFDKPGGKEQLIQENKAERDINLKPRSVQRVTRPRVMDPRSRGNITGERAKPPIPSAAHRRAIESGILKDSDRFA